MVPQQRIGLLGLISKSSPTASSPAAELRLQLLQQSFFNDTLYTIIEQFREYS
jgi:hypothetical protein